ncbi:MAG TPA: hypothetical protein VH722_00650 [Alphaproteobacteria bacterium]|jgi:hypothetical protein|nr:hypothetical protein [Alphaproteobacteria bacterium]
MAEAAGLLAAVALTVAGVVALRSVWASDTPSRLWLLGGWLALSVASLGWTALATGDKAVALALLVPSPVAYLIVALGSERTRRRNGRRRDGGSEIEPAAGPARPWRAAARFLLAGPLSAIAAAAIGTAISLCPFWSEPNRIIAGGLLAPAVWAAGMCWSLSDDRLGRVAAGLAATILVAGVTVL